MISIGDFFFKKTHVFREILVSNPGIYILSLIPIRRQEHRLGAFMTPLLLMKTKLSSIAFLWGNKNSKIKSFEVPPAPHT
jgi:hypothetical protein